MWPSTKAAAGLRSEWNGAYISIIGNTWINPTTSSKKSCFERQPMVNMAKNSIILGWFPFPPLCIGWRLKREASYTVVRSTSLCLRRCSAHNIHTNACTQYDFSTYARATNIQPVSSSPPYDESRQRLLLHKASVCMYHIFLGSSSLQLCVSVVLDDCCDHSWPCGSSASNAHHRPLKGVTDFQSKPDVLLSGLPVQRRWTWMGKKKRNLHEITWAFSFNLFFFKCPFF